MPFTNAYALTVGIANYEHVNRLSSAVLNDATDISKLLISPEYCDYLPENVQHLTDGQANRAALRQAFANLAQCSDRKSTVLIYISGHGGRIENGPYAGQYLLPVDVDYTSDESVAETAISDKEVTGALHAISASKVVVIFDCCHAGGIGQPKNLSAPEMKVGFSESYYDALKQGIGRVILASSRSTEFSWILPGAKNSLFTQHLLAALKGGIASDDGLIRIFDLFEYVQPRVTADKPIQHPIFKAEMEENFAVSFYCGGKKRIVSEDQDGFRYDVYISYVDKEPDTTWVWEMLMPRLLASGLRVAVSGDSADPGVPHVVSIERGIIQSKRILAVLSNAYMADHTADFEAIMAQTKDIQDGTYRLLPVKIAPLQESKLSLRLGMLTMLDLSHPHRAEREFDRLLHALQGPLPRE